MSGAWRKTLMYLGLVEDEDGFESEASATAAPNAQEPHPPRLRRVSSPPQPVSARPEDPPVADAGEAIVRTIPQHTQAATVHRAEPQRFNEARGIGERFREGVPVVLNLRGTEDGIARRLMDFASGLVFGLDGKMELLGSRVYLLTPRDVEVSDDERERLREGDLFDRR